MRHTREHPTKNLPRTASKAESSGTVPQTGRFSTTPGVLHRALNSPEEGAPVAQ